MTIEKLTDATKEEKKKYNRCITCNKGCSMSGICMKMWPEFVNRQPKGAGKNAKNA